MIPERVLSSGWLRKYMTVAEVLGETQPSWEYTRTFKASYGHVYDENSEDSSFEEKHHSSEDEIV